MQTKISAQMVTTVVRQSVKKQHGFTLIELLLVIAVIGILASVVIGAVNDARGKGADASIKQSIGNMRAEAELYYEGSGNGFVNMCNDATIQDALSNSNDTNGAGTVTCVDGSHVPGQWAVEAQLVASSTFFYCIDYNGTGIETVGSTISTASGAEDATCGP